MAVSSPRGRLANHAPERAGAERRGDGDGAKAGNIIRELESIDGHGIGLTEDLITAIRTGWRVPTECCSAATRSDKRLPRGACRSRGPAAPTPTAGWGYSRIVRASSSPQVAYDGCRRSPTSGFGGRAFHL